MGASNWIKRRGYSSMAPSEAALCRQRSALRGFRDQLAIDLASVIVCLFRSAQIS
jgi:hypothetical protein